jgi:diaminohydroxyphosphoribosylaminopyrimidine deaminase / 5-amino-6-(5-phosphoribosylamino)uracil reductase
MSVPTLPTSDFDFSALHMARALELAERGRGFVEPNPMVGCVIVDDEGQIVGEGYHTRFGAAHAEVEALKVAGARARGATMLVTLEPCCHHGKTPPCTQAVIAAGVTRVIAAMRDPFPQVAGGGLTELQAAGIEVAVGLLEEQARELNAPYLKLIETGRPWIIAKWAMTLDGKLATRTGDSKWISNEASREIVHALRGRVDAILVGRGTALADDPLLTARPPGARVATRVVVDSQATLPTTSRLVQTAGQIPVIVAVAPEAPASERSRLQNAGCEVFSMTGADRTLQIDSLLAELERRKFTNVLVEGGGELLGSLFDMNMVNEVHTFIAPILAGGCEAISPVEGLGVDTISAAKRLVNPHVEVIAGVVYIHGRLQSK